jgi:predicted metal-dependent hydrolase
VLLRAASGKGLEIVIPKGFDPGKIPEVLMKHRRWLERAAEKLTQAAPLPDPAVLLPATIELPALALRFMVRYHGDSSGRLATLDEFGMTLVLGGAGGNSETYLVLLQRWLQRLASRHLIPWLTGLCAETGLSCDAVQIRAQKTRWGSCSRRRTVSLNRSLLFLRPEVVRYLMIHELCHTRELNHSSRFWDLVESFEPDWQVLDKELTRAAGTLPPWAAWKP